MIKRFTPRKNHNPFLSLPDYPWVVEYDDYGWEWDTSAICELTRLWTEARPIVRRIQVFHRWFETAFTHAHDAHRAVLQILEATR